MPPGQSQPALTKRLAGAVLYVGAGACLLDFLAVGLRNQTNVAQISAASISRSRLDCRRHFRMHLLDLH